jgi:hypothetical protein
MRLASMAAITLAGSLVGCSGSIAFGPSREPPPAASTPLPTRLVVVGNSVIEEPLTPIESVIEGMSQAQSVRTLTKALAK